MSGDEEAVVAGGEAEAEAAGGGSNVTEMELMENFVRSLVEGWRYQGRTDTKFASNGFFVSGILVTKLLLM